MKEFTPVQTSPTDFDLLSAFARSGDEAAFAALVGRYAGLVRATAQRTAGQAEVAEETAQSVFALLARKAASVARMDHLAGWLHRTAVYTALRHLRAETRHRRKLTAFATHTMHASAPESSPAWEAALPVLDACIQHLREGERRVLIMRYFEGLSYPGIGAATGKSEEAAKKQTARALERLRLLMHRRGAVLSATALACGLASQTPSHATAAAVAAPLAAAALQAAPALTRKSLLLHSLHLMNTTKTGALAALVLLCSVPIIWQETAIAAARREVTALEHRHLPIPEGAGPDTAGTSIKPGVAGVVAPVAGPLDIEQVARDLEILRTAGRRISPASLSPVQRAAFDRIAALKTPDFNRLLGDAAQLSGGATRQVKIRRALFDELAARPADTPGRLVLLHWVGEIARTVDNDALFQIQHHAGTWLTDMLKEDPDAALREYLALRKSGDFEGKGTMWDGQVTYGQFVGKLHAVRPDLAKELYADLTHGGRLNALNGMVESRDPADREFVLSEVAKLETLFQRSTFQAMLAVELAHTGLTGAGTLFQALPIAPELKADVAAGFVSDTNSGRAQAGLTVPQRLDWLRLQLPPEQFARAGAKFLSESIEITPQQDRHRNDAGMEALRAADWGAHRDLAIATFFQSENHPNNVSPALTLAMEITDPALRMETLKSLRHRFEDLPEDYQKAVQSSPSLTAAEKAQLSRP
jgi:RNA polymerase sigma factor (sigma-70 family)